MKKEERKFKTCLTFLKVLIIVSACFVAIYSANATFVDETLEALEKNYSSAVNIHARDAEAIKIAIENEKQSSDNLCNAFRALKTYKESRNMVLKNDSNPCIEKNLSTKTNVKTYKVYFTSYNPVNRQTDSSPCVGASGINQCAEAKKGTRMIALSQDLVGRTGNKPFRYGDKVYLESELKDPRCNGDFIVMDTMNSRFRMRGDLFIMDKKDNISCYATISKI